MLCKCVHDVELYAWVACEAIEGHVRVSLGVVIRRVVDNADNSLAASRENQLGLDEQCLTSSIAFAHNKVPTASQNPVNGEPTGFKALVGIVCCLRTITPVLDVELLALSKRKERNCCSDDELAGKHLVEFSMSSHSWRLKAIFVLGLHLQRRARRTSPSLVFTNIGILPHLHVLTYPVGIA